MWRPRAIPAVLGLLAVCALAELPQPPAAQMPEQTPAVVYVCACLRNRSCPCMSEAMQKGPCACGTKGGPPMKEVLAGSAWARYNRKVLAGPSDDQTSPPAPARQRRP